MPTSITIRNVPDEVRDDLAARAASSGRSLQEYLRSELIELAERPDMHVFIEGARRRKSVTGSTLDSSTILAERDADRA